MSFEINYEYRTGIGTDMHRLVDGVPLKLGGVVIPFEKGLYGHSDGDAVLHAVGDALIGAAGLGDIGMFFPDDDPLWKDADSRDLLLNIARNLENKGWEVVNVDVIVHAEQPRLGQHRLQMKRCIASILGTDFNNVNIKAKTGEGLGDIGKGRTIAATAIVLLRRKLKRTL